MVMVASFQQPESPVRLLQHNVHALLDKNDLGIGTLYVSERNISWQKQDNLGFQIEYNNVTLHGISKDTNIYSRDCLYILTDGRFNTENALFSRREENGSGESEEEDEVDISELVLAPENTTSLQNIYDAIKECQALNPDMEDAEEEYEDDHLYADAEENMENDTENRDHAIEDLSRRLENNYVNNGINHQNEYNHDEDSEIYQDEYIDEDEFEDAV